MSGRFCDAAVQLGGLAARVLHWPPDTFWNATPSELAACLQHETRSGTTPPSLIEIAAMIERDSHA